MEIDSRHNKTKEVCQYISDEFFDILKDLKTLELGPMDGWFTEKLFEKTKNITCVELEKRACDILNSKFPTLTIIEDDFNEYLRIKNQFEAVVALGVTYHLHDPIGFFENLVNNIGPEYILVDAIHQDVELTIDHEQPNISGMRQLKRDQKSSNLVLVFSMSLIERILNNLGYQKIREKGLTPNEWKMWSPNIFKDGFRVAVFERV